MGAYDTRGHRNRDLTLTKDPAGARAKGRPEMRIHPAASSQMLFIFQINSQVTAEPSKIPESPLSVSGTPKCRKPRNQPLSPLARHQIPLSHASLPRRVSQGAHNSATRYGQQNHREQPRTHSRDTHICHFHFPTLLPPNPLHQHPPTH